MNKKGLLALILITCSSMLMSTLTLLSLGQPGTRTYQQQITKNRLPTEQLHGITETAVAPTITHLAHTQRPPRSSGGGEYQFPHDELTPAEQQAIQSTIDANIRQLFSDAPALTPETTVTLSWPLSSSTPHEFSYYGIANFVDQNFNYPNQLRDYACGDRTYDLYTGYNHGGTDIFLWPFPWNKMDSNEVTVTAAAPGVIVFRQDGYFDRSCSFNNQPWNAVYVRHADGSVAWYGHLKNGSVTSKGVGQTVQRGEYLGVVGSSGSSTGPHLHLELHDVNGRLLDPYAGACNALNGRSLWGSQPSYYDPVVNRLTTGSAAPDISGCNDPEQPNEATEFDPGDTIYFTTYYRDQQGALPSQYTLYQPNGDIYQAWQHSINVPHYAASWWWWSFDLEPDAPQGIWRFTVQFANNLYETEFTVGEIPPPPPVEPTPVLTVTHPNGGEVLAPGAFTTITWQTVLTEMVRVDLYWQGVFSQTMGWQTAVSGTGQIGWQIPISTPTSASYTIRISDTISGALLDESNNQFIIGIITPHSFLPLTTKSAAP